MRVENRVEYLNTDFEDRKKEILAWILLGGTFLLLVLLNIGWGEHWIDSDMAAEMIFAKQVAEEGGLIASPNWYYSTEFRILYTQLIMVPLFKILGTGAKWAVIRVITNVVTYVLLILSYFYCCKPLKLKKYVVIGTSAILLMPFGEQIMTHVQMGNTYMWHMLLINLLVGAFFRLSGIQGRADIVTNEIVPSASRTRHSIGVAALIFVALNVILGMSGVRYLLAIQVPLLLTAIIYILCADEFRVYRAEVNMANFSLMFAEDRKRSLLVSIAGAFLGVVGYGINAVVLSGKYPFQTYETTSLIKVYNGVFLERLQNTLGSLLFMFGYIEDRALISVKGIVSLCAFVWIGLVIFGFVRLVKLLKDSDLHKFMLILFAVAFCLNTFIFIFATGTIVARYYVTVFLLAVSLIAVYFQREEMELDKILVLVILTIILVLGVGKCSVSYITNDKNAAEKPAIEFLKQQGYEFGYSTYWNGNVITELTDGEIEVAVLHDLDHLQGFKWSSPTKYYEKDYYDDKCFVILTQEEFAAEGLHENLLKGTKVYEDAAYVVLEYATTEGLMLEY